MDVQQTSVYTLSMAIEDDKRECDEAVARMNVTLSGLKEEVDHVAREADEHMPTLVCDLHDLLDRMNLAVAKMPRNKLRKDAMRHISTCMEWADYLEGDFPAYVAVLAEDDDEDSP